VTGAQLVLYSKTSQAQFINMTDGRKRGTAVRWIRGFDTRLPVTTTTAGAPAAAGDEATLRLSLYTNATLTERAGTGMLTCHYDSGSDALCDATFQLADGRTLSATGLLGGRASGYSLVVTGGNAMSSGDRGEVESDPEPNHLQKLSFTLVPEANVQPVTA
jgi:hypothetical protein